VLLPSRDRMPAQVTSNKASTEFFDYLTLPDDPPLKQDLDDNHYKLPLRIRDDVQASEKPREFKMISRLDYDFMKGKAGALPVYNDDRPDQDRDVCACTVRCDDNCINRMMKMECCGDVVAGGDEGKAARPSARGKANTNCALGPGCGNRCFEEKDYAKTERFREHAMGFGLRAAEDIPEGKMVIEYIGEVIDTDEVVNRMENQRKFYPNDHDFYIMELDQGYFVDGKFKVRFTANDA
jgi:hypothetical protein